MTLTEFLLARIAEDEAVALGLVEWAGPRGAEWNLANAIEDTSDEERAYGARLVPARVLAEVEAQRRIVALYRQWEDAGGYPPAYWDAPVDLIVQALANVYADHPDYDEAWRP